MFTISGNLLLTLSFNYMLPSFPLYEGLELFFTCRLQEGMPGVFMSNEYHVPHFLNASLPLLVLSMFYMHTDTELILYHLSFIL
jgi:hypothetical protein